MCLILQIICLMSFIGGHRIYGQEVMSPGDTASDPSTIQEPTSENPQQDLGEQNQVPATQQGADTDIPDTQSALDMNQQAPVDEKKMREEWRKAQQQASATTATVQQVLPTQSTPVPQMPQKESKPKPPVPVIEEIKGINTVDLEESRGNWLFKRIWWERAEQKYEKIRLLVEKIIDSRMEFFEKRTQIDRTILDPFKHTMGMDQGEMKTIVGQLIAQLQQERDKDGVLNAQERDLLQLALNEKKSLEQLQGYIETITKLDIELDEALNKLHEQINAIRRYERDAWQEFKDIARVLSDTKARELYYNMDVAWTNIQEVQEYLQEPFKEHYDHIINMIITHVDFINKTVQALKEKGIDLQARMKAQTDKHKTCAVQESDDEQQEEPEESEQGFIGRTLSAITAGFITMWDYTVFVVTWPYVKLFGSAEAQEEESEEEDMQQEQEQPEPSAESLSE